MDKHTPGPWKLLEVGDAGRLCPAAANNHSILTLEDEDGTTFAAVYEEADAHLIATAPEMLEALEAVLGYGSMTGAEWVTEKVTAVIAKATGSQA